MQTLYGRDERTKFSLMNLVVGSQKIRLLKADNIQCTT